MAVAGGVCMCLIDHICNSKMKYSPLIPRCLAGSAIITGVELLIGSVVNLGLKMNVWDYSNMPLNLWGQICLPFSLLWFFLSIPAMGLCSLFGKSKKLS